MNSIYIIYAVNRFKPDWINRIQAYEKNLMSIPVSTTYEIPSYMWDISQQYMGYLSKKKLGCT